MIQADTEFNKAMEDALKSLELIKKEIEAMAVSQKDNNKNWGYTGSMQKVETDLHELKRFLGNNEKE